MANKKISQLSAVGEAGVTKDCLFPVASGEAGGPYTTLKSTALQVAEYILNPIPAVDSASSPLPISGTNTVYLNNSSYTDSSAGAPATHGYLMVRKSDGLLTTGSGIASPVGGDDLGDHNAITRLNMQSNNIENIGNNMMFSGGGNIGITPTTLSIYKPNIALEATSEIKLNGTGVQVNCPLAGEIEVTGGDLIVDPTKKIITDEIEVQSVSYHTPHNNSSSYAINWANSNIQYTQIPAGNTSTGLAFTFSNSTEGQTLTLYVKNLSSSRCATPTFYGQGVEWGGEFSGIAPYISTRKTTLYNFVKINSVIFGSAVTGYDLF